MAGLLENLKKRLVKSPRIYLRDSRVLHKLLAIAVLSTFDIRKAEALSFVLVFHATWYVPQTLLGLVVLTQKNLHLWQLIGKQS